MTSEPDVLVIGGGPAGQKAAVQAAKAGKRVLLVEKTPSVGGECVQRGTIPSKTMRESAVYLHGLRRRAEGLLGMEVAGHTKVQSLMQRLGEVLRVHQEYMSRQVDRNGIEVWNGRARFLDARRVEVTMLDGERRTVAPEWIVIATGSRPRRPTEVPVDHEHVLDSDSILSLIYLPDSLTVLGGGVIATEFASIFQALGVRVTVIDKTSRPLLFLESELVERFVEDFEASGGRFLSESATEEVTIEPDGRVRARLASGEVVVSEKMLVALGRVASVRGLAVEAAGIELSERGHVPVDEHCRTVVPHIYAAGDVIGPPALAASSMEQGRRAMHHALGLGETRDDGFAPTGIYAIPEMASVGLTEAEARERHRTVTIGRARFEEIARGQINGEARGLLKLVTDARAERLLGAHIVGEGATELIHVAQMALIGGLPVRTFVDNLFNFPTLAEAYRVAALDACAKAESALRLAG